MNKNHQYVVVAIVALVVLFVVLYGVGNKFDYELPDFGLNSNIEKDIEFISQAEVLGKEWNSNATLQAITMIDGAQPLGIKENRRIAVFGEKGESKHFLIKSTKDGHFLPEENETVSIDTSSTLVLGEFKVSSQKAFDKAHKKARKIKANGEDKVSINLTLIDDNGRLVWSYLLIVERKNILEGEPAGTVLFVTLDARSGRILNEQQENL